MLTLGMLNDPRFAAILPALAGVAAGNPSAMSPANLGQAAARGSFPIPNADQVAAGAAPAIPDGGGAYGIGGRGAGALPSAVDASMPPDMRGGGRRNLGDLLPVSVNSPAPLPMMQGRNLGDLVGQLPQGKIPDHKGLFHGKDWKTLASIALGAIGDGLTAYSGGTPLFGPMMARRNLEDRQHAHDLDRFRAELQAKRMEPQSVGGSLIQWNPQTNRYETLYDAPSAAESYAIALGLQPGTPEYADAMQTYVLRGYSDAAMPNRLGLIDHRYDRSDQQLDRRLDQSDINNRRTTGVSRENNIRSTGQSNTNNLRTTAQSNTNNLRSTDTSTANNVRTNETHLRTAKRVRALPNEPVATDGQGRRLVVRNGQWVPAE